MPKNKIADGTAHKTPPDLARALLSESSVTEKWENLTPLARNEWVCWTISVKQQKTRDEHVKRVISELGAGKRRPCCWIGCIHRKDKAISPTQKWIIEKQAKSK